MILADGQILMYLKYWQDNEMSYIEKKKSEHNGRLSEAQSPSFPQESKASREWFSIKWKINHSACEGEAQGRLEESKLE